MKIHIRNVPELTDWQQTNLGRHLLITMDNCGIPVDGVQVVFEHPTIAGESNA